jgi:enoyl-[acyl-carrier-protein] reductase (NADH)
VTTKHDPVGLTDTANTGISCCHLSRLGELLREKQPMLRFTTPEEIGGVAVFVCSESAVTMTGASVWVDRGWTAQ